MKKNYSNYLKKVSHRTIAYVFLTALSVSVLLYSCRKIGAVPNEYAKPPIDIAAVITKNDLLNWYDDLPAPEQNQVSNIVGLTNGTVNFLFHCSGIKRSNAL